MTLPLIVVLEGNSIALPLPRPAHPHEWRVYPETSPDEVVSRLREAEVAVINKAKLTAGVLAQLPALRMISVSATGTDNVDLAACRERGIVVTNVAGYADESVTEHALALIFALRRNLIGYVADVRAGLWAAAPSFSLSHRPVRDIAGETLAIIGRGALGEALARRAAALGMKILYAERKGAAQARPGYTPFEDALARADIVSLHCPLDASTRGLIGEAELARMKPDAILINTARGAIVDEAALASALKTGLLAGAATDVLSEEPPRSPNPLLAADIPNLIITPHMAWTSQGALQRLVEATIRHVDAFLDGAPLNRVA
ncbi:D-2-hydroxyacid dehydrogenase [Niveibacterium terrae]|uniref:D-2-hydroxyacid dehydrogenase n=1 Tax=Niveibacterium terrae TaxID=3373598 RepID=UPI003A916122